MVSQYTMVVGIVVGAIGVMAVVYGMDVIKMSVSFQEYELFVDPIIEKQNLFVTARVTIQNVGSETVTGLRVNFGDGDVLDLGSLAPGKKLIVSPPEDNSMQFVQVYGDNDVFVSKAYREPPKMVGMMGS